MSKELKALYKLFWLASYCNENVEGMNEKEMKEYDKKCENMKKIIEQALIQKAKQKKILDILKKKYAIQLFTDEPWEQLEYKMLVGGNLVIDLTQEEYDLLKEWLKNDYI